LFEVSWLVSRDGKFCCDKKIYLVIFLTLVDTIDRIFYDNIVL